jgi:hypothetical protein
MLFIPPLLLYPAQFASWLTCFWQGSDSPPVEGPAARPNTFEIRFEDVQELKWIGAGAHGCVFLGTYNHEEVAVKKLREKSMTMREVRLLRTLRHENIVELKGVCTQPPVYCLVMEVRERLLLMRARLRAASGVTPVTTVVRHRLTLQPPPFTPP